MVRPALIDFNPAYLKYNTFMTSVDKCSENCNILSPKICVSKKKTKYINAKVFNIITNKMKLEPLQNIFHVIVNANSIV